MLAMAFKLLGGPILSKVIDGGTRYLQKRQEISEAKHTVRMEIESKKATADIDWDQIMARNSQNSWKDEYLTIVITMPFILLFLPWTREFAEQGFLALNGIDDRYWYLFGVAVAAIFGVRDVIKGIGTRVKK